MNENLIRFVCEDVQSPEAAKMVDSILCAFDDAAADGFRLAPTSELKNDEEIAKAIATLSGRRVDGIIPVSAADPRLAIRDGEVASDLVRDTEESLWDRLFSRNHHTLWEELGKNRGNKFMCFLEADLAKLVDKLVASCLKSCGGYDLRRLVQRHLYHPLAYFMGFALTGDVERMNRILPVLALLLNGVVPIAEKKGDPRKWYVLTA